MSGERRLSGFYFITDSGLSVNGVREDVRLALLAGVALVQYREKKKPFAERLREAAELKEMCERSGVPFIVNDDVELARAVRAAGVHLGQEDMPLREARRILGPAAIIGVSTGTPEEARTAAGRGADYVAANPIFNTLTKEDAGPGIGVEGLRAIRAAVSLPLAAIGGINRENVKLVRAAGADLICAISASLAHGAVTENIRALMA